MAHFLKGRYRGFYPAGSSACVRDIFRFKKYGENSLRMELTRRDAESMLQRFWRYENASITLHPVNEDEPRLGGKVEAKSIIIDFRTLTFAFKT